MADETTPKSIVELEQPDWMNPPEGETTPPKLPMPPTPEKKEPEEPTGVENVVVDENQTAPRPANWQEAVADHFTPKPKPTPAGGQTEETAPKFGNMQDVIDFLEERKAAIHLPTKEELEKERRRKKTEGIISSIADASRAVANLVFTTQHAPDMYRHEESSMTGRWKKRYDDLKKEREADADRYLNYALTIGKLKDAQDAREYQHGRDALQDQIRMSQEARAQLKADRDAAMADLKMQLMAGKITQQEAAARAKEIEAEYADQYWNARVDELKSRKNKNDRWQPSTGRRGGGGGGRPAEHAWRDKNGNLHYCHSESAARSQAAANGGTYVTTPTRRTSTKPDKWGNPSTTTTETDVSTPKVTIDWN